MTKALIVSFLLGSAASAQAPAAIPRGAIVEKVDCAEAAGQSYSLYLPERYAAGRKWPILYLFDARSRGPLPARLFRDAAEKHGVILASSNNTRSDGPVDPNITALRAMWNDTHARLSIDDRRIYAGGFSGGARLATIMASTAPGTVAGVIGCAAGFHAPLRDKPAFAYFGTAGNRDFNYREMRELDATLDGLGSPHRIEYFDGEHDWPPKELAETALAWLDLQAIKERRLPADDQLVDSFIAEESARAEALEASHPAEALRQWKMLRNDAAGLREVAPLDAAIARLSASRRVKDSLREESERQRQDDAIKRRFAAVWRKLREPDATLLLAPIVEELQIPLLRRRARASPGSEDSLAAERLLAEISAQAGFYLAEGFRTRGNFSRAILCLSVAAEAKPDRASTWYNLAALHALAGRPNKALENLRTAIEKGFRDADSLSKDSDFSSMSAGPEFRKIVEELKAAPPTGRGSGAGG